MTASALKIGDTLSLEDALTLWGRRNTVAAQVGEQIPPDERPLSSHWHVVFVQPKAEKKAVEKLKEAGFQVYGPVIRIDRQVSRRCRKWKTYEHPMFPRYVFVGGDMDINRVKFVENIVDYLRDGERAASVPLTVISRVQQAEHQGVFNVERGKTKLFDAGEKVKIITGIFSYFPAVVKQALLGEEAEVLVDLLGQIVPMKMPVDYLRKDSCEEEANQPIQGTDEIGDRGKRPDTERDRHG